MTIRINNTDYKIKYTIRAMFVWEQIMKKSFNLETTLDNYAYFYSLILANNPDNAPSWNDFLNAVETNPNLINELLNYLTEYHKSQEIFNDEEVAKEITGDGEKKN